MKLVCGTGLSKIEPYLPSGLGLSFTNDNETYMMCKSAMDNFFSLYFSTGEDYEATYKFYFTRKDSIPFDK